MAKLSWDGLGSRFFETGVSKGVLYPQVAGAYPAGVAWNGLTAVTESPSGAEPTPMYADNTKYLNLFSAEEFGFTVEAYSYPPEFYPCDGSVEAKSGVLVGQQTRQPFGFSYQTIVGNDTEGNDHAVKIHLVWGCLASPTEKAYASVNDSPEAATFSWEVSTTPVFVEGLKPTALITLDSRDLSEADWTAVTDVLYGTATNPPHLPMPDALLALITGP